MVYFFLMNDGSAGGWVVLYVGCGQRGGGGEGEKGNDESGNHLVDPVSLLGPDL